MENLKKLIRGMFTQLKIKVIHLEIVKYSWRNPRLYFINEQILIKAYFSLTKYIPNQILK